MNPFTARHIYKRGWTTERGVLGVLSLFASRFKCCSGELHRRLRPQEGVKRRRASRKGRSVFLLSFQDSDALRSALGIGAVTEASGRSLWAEAGWTNLYMFEGLLVRQEFPHIWPPSSSGGWGGGSSSSSAPTESELETFQTLFFLLEFKLDQTLRKTISKFHDFLNLAFILKSSNHELDLSRTWGSVKCRTDVKIRLHMNLWLVLFYMQHKRNFYCRISYIWEIKSRI